MASGITLKSTNDSIVNIKNVGTTTGTTEVTVPNVNGTMAMERIPASSIGYKTGDGGLVVQATSKNTAVTLNKPCGQISMNAQALAAGASVTFTLNNTLIGTGSVVLLNAVNNGSYAVVVASVWNGQVSIRVTNITGGSLSEGLPINFAILSTTIS